MGHEVVLVPADAGVSAMIRRDRAAQARFSEKVVELFRRENSARPFDLVFAYVKEGMLDVAAIDELRRAGAPCCNFSCNNVHQFGLVAPLARHFDYNLHSEQSASEKFRAIGARALYWPMASNPKYFHPVSVERTVDISFVGSEYANRAEYVHALLTAGTDVHAFGPGWTRTNRRARSALKRCYLCASATLARSDQRWSASASLAAHDRVDTLNHRYAGHFHPPLPDEELIALYSRSVLSLGIIDVYDEHDASRSLLQHMHLRDFEAPMCGALYITGYMPEIEQHFVPGREILVYRNRHELVDQVKHYLAKPAEGDRVREAGLRRALSDHTYHKRFHDLFRALGLAKLAGKVTA